MTKTPTRLALILAPVLLALIAALGWAQFREARAGLLAEQERLAAERHFAVAAMLADADRQLRRMETRMRLSMAAGPGLGDRAEELAPVVAGGIAATEWAGAGPERGNLIGIPDLAARATGPVAAALDLLPPLEVEAAIGGAPSWSYFFSAGGDFITILPGAGLGDFLAAAPPVPDAAALIAHWLTYPVFALGTPQANPARAPYWTPPYDDAGGAGRMVSHAMPVYDGDRFVGVVGTDILLAALAEVLAHMASPLGAIGLATGGGEMLAGDLGGRLDGALVAEAAAEGGFARRGGDWVLARGFPGTPFLLLTVIPEAELRAMILPGLAGTGLLLLAGAAGLVAALVWYDRRHLRPGLRLAAYAEAAATSRGEPPAPPAELPPAWAARAGAVARAFAAAREDRAALAASEARYRNVVDTQTELVARHTPDGRATFANKAYCRQLGQSLEEVLAGRESQFDYVAPEDRARHAEHLASLTPEHPTSTTTIKVWLPRAPGDFWEEWTDTGIFDAEGRLIELQSVGRDVTEKVRAEEELRRQRDALHQSEKLAALGSLLAGVAHELNNPLSIVVGYAGMLHELAEDEPTRRRTGEIARAADRCARIVRTFLAMARARPAEKSEVDLGAVVDQVLELTAYGLRSNGIEVARVPGTPPPVLADPDQVHQVVMNVILNAQQAMMGVTGPRRLTIRAGEEAGAAVLSIADTGPGIDPAIAERVFEPFFTTKPQGVGTGIGLAVSRGIVEAHGGAIALSPAAGGGTLCRITLPAMTATAPEGPDGPDGAGSPGRGRVLIVDDEPALGALLAEALTRDGHHAVAVTDPEAALRAAAADRFDAVLTDLRMPGMGGDQLAARLVALAPRLKGRIIVMTGDALRVPAEADFPVLEKPVEIAALRAALARALDQDFGQGFGGS
ncbi:MAG: hypothetical protein DI556_14415 [Rhodovulum sulfidophilum]|uniref:histidine kinase n=1 Tax=Rhodovulum sulfidophilum TaxID=35806 RepID=A0A2W5QAB2_RHOSU|nr:MAG: hypothetical protein DI556_14415 [Rhodovulum sulfidophilum]